MMNRSSVMAAALAAMSLGACVEADGPLLDPPSGEGPDDEMRYEFRASCDAFVEMPRASPGCTGERVGTGTVSFPCLPVEDPLGPGTRRWRSIGLTSTGSAEAGTYACGESASFRVSVPCASADPVVVVALDDGDGIANRQGTCGWDSTGSWHGFHVVR